MLSDISDMSWWSRWGSAALIMVVVVASSACAHRTAERAITLQQIGEPGQTRIVNYKNAPARPGSPSEDTPGSIARDAVADEAQLVSLADGHLCIDLTVRTHVDLDEPLAVYQIELNGERIYPGEEFISVVDYSYTGERTLFAAEGVTSEAFAAMRLSQPEERTYRVIERQTELCGVVAMTNQIQLDLKLLQDDGRGHWGQSFVWEIR